MKNAAGWFCFVLLLGAIGGFSAGRMDVSAQTLDNKPVKGGGRTWNENITLVRAAKPAKKDLPAGNDIKAGKKAR